MGKRFSALMICLGLLTVPAGVSLGAAFDVAGEARKVEQATGRAVDYAVHPVTGAVRMLRVKSAAPAGESSAAGAVDREGAARSGLAVAARLFGIGDPERELKAVRQKTADGNRHFVRFRQQYRDLPVLGGEMIVQLDADGTLAGIFGRTSPFPDLDTAPTVAADDAVRIALEQTAQSARLDKGRLAAGTPLLAVYNPALFGHADAATRLVWQIDVTDPGSAKPLRQYVVVDAKNGRVMLSFNQAPEALNRKVYDNRNIEATAGDPNEGLPGLPGEGPVRTEGTPASGLTEVDYAYDFLGDSYNFYRDYHGRDSLDNAGMTLVGTVRYCPAGDCPYGNAFWNGKQMVFGDTFAAGDDVVGHELTHAVTEMESGLVYYMQSGAINESFSDVWGEFIDLTNGKGNDTAGARWLMGEDLPPNVGVIRDMRDPTRFNDPDRTGSIYYKCVAPYWDGYYFFQGDNGGVHTNSGVSNKAAFLMTDGGSFNGRTVTGIGIAKVAKIYYEAQTNLLWSTSDYLDLYAVLQQACSNLVGSAGITSADCQQVKNALDAVEMGQAPPFCPPPTEAPLCDTGRYALPPVFFDDFERGAANWVLSDPVRWGVVGLYPASGSNHLWGYDDFVITDGSAAMAASRQIPADAFLHFKHSYNFENGYDFGRVEYSADNGATWIDAKGLFDNNGYNGTGFTGAAYGYGSSRLNLGSLAGSSLQFRFRITTNDSNPYYYTYLGWIIDDVRLYSCAVVPDDQKPTIKAFSMTATASTLTVPIITLTAFDNIGVAGYYLSESTAVPAASAPGWTTSAPTSFTFGGLGTRVLFAWVKDYAGNISTPKSVTVIISDTQPPTIDSFSVPPLSTQLTLTGISIVASDNIGVTGYYLSESPTPPTAASAAWTAAPPTSYTFSDYGGKTLYAWAKDAIGYVSAVRSAETVIRNDTTTNLIVNGDFESGAAGWTQYSSFAPTSANPLVVSAAGTGNGGSSGFASLGGHNGVSEYLYQDVTIPADAVSTSFSFSYSITSEENSGAWDVLRVHVVDPVTGEVLYIPFTLTNSQKTSGWVRSASFDMLPYAGRTVRVRFSDTTDGSNLTTFRVDDVVLSVTLPGRLPLAVSVSGNGTGSVHSTPAGISCTSGSGSGCSASFPTASSVSLVAVAGSDSLFTGWGGSCRGSGACTVALDNPKTVNATFSMVTTAMVGAVPFGSLSTAYAAALDGARILLLDADLTEGLAMNRGIGITLAGGYNASFTALTGQAARLNGFLSVETGCLTADGVAVK